MFAWNEMVFLQKLLILNFIVVLLHQFEEYSGSGGFPAVANMVLFSSEKPDCYPLNQNSSMVNLWGCLIAASWMIVFFYLDFILIEQKWLGDKNSPYPFDQDEMKRGGIEKKLEHAR